MLYRMFKAFYHATGVGVGLGAGVYPAIMALIRTYFCRDKAMEIAEQVFEVAKTYDYTIEDASSHACSQFHYQMERCAGVSTRDNSFYWHAAAFTVGTGLTIYHTLRFTRMVERAEGMPKEERTGNALLGESSDSDIDDDNEVLDSFAESEAEDSEEETVRKVKIRKIHVKPVKKYKND